MERNFWTEENKIMDYDSLFRADLQNKIMRMSNQIVVGKDIADSCYNYNYFIVQREKAIQFITDYAEEFVKSLDTYKKSVGKDFANIDNPLMVVNLMALYKGREVLENCEYVKENLNNEIVLNDDTISLLCKEIGEPVLVKEDLLLEKVFTTKADLLHVCANHLCSELRNLCDENITLTKALSRVKEPILNEKIMRSVLKNSYAEIAKIVLESEEISTKDLGSFMTDVVSEKIQSVLVNDLELGNTNVPLNREMVDYFQSLVEENSNVEIEFNPMLDGPVMEDKIPIKNKIMEK